MGTTKSKLLHRNPYGVRMLREDYKKRSQVKVLSEYIGKHRLLRSYRFNLIPDCFDVPFCSWANLDCCGGWAFDKTYLDTAVQKGKKLFAGRTQYLKSLHLSDCLTRDEALQEFQKIVNALPDGITAGIAGKEDDKELLYTYICREGRIADYFDLKTVFEFYGKLGLKLSGKTVDGVKKLCNLEIKTFGGEDPPFLYYQASTEIELITTGLLLGYPIESTTSVLCGY